MALKYRFIEDGLEWHDIPENDRYGLSEITACSVAAYENNQCAGELFADGRGRLRDDVRVQIRSGDDIKTFTVSADYSIDFFAHETDT